MSTNNVEDSHTKNPSFFILFSCILSMCNRKKCHAVASITLKLDHENYLAFIQNWEGVSGDTEKWSMWIRSIICWLLLKLCGFNREFDALSSIFLVPLLSLSLSMYFRFVYVTNSNLLLFYVRWVAWTTCSNDIKNIQLLSPLSNPSHHQWDERNASYYITNEWVWTEMKLQHRKWSVPNSTE